MAHKKNNTNLTELLLQVCPLLKFDHKYLGEIHLLMGKDHEKVDNRTKLLDVVAQLTEMHKPPI